MPNQLGLYIHWPFCVSKCPYCDFNSHVAGNVNHEIWRTSLLREIEFYGQQTKGRQLGSVFFGGGTPSLMPATTVAAILDSIPIYWDVLEDAEITLEANPTSSETNKFDEFRRAGVNRISIGAQSFDDTALAFLGRSHSGNSVRKAVTDALQCFDRVSFDLIYGLPGFDLAHWVSELKKALRFATGHLSLYQLSIEKGTRFYSDHQNGAFVLPSEELATELYQETNNIMEDAGYCAYEISNYAKIGEECRHNLTYWEGGDYVGVGPGAHGRITLEGARIRTEQISGPENWLKAVLADGHATRAFEPMPVSEQVEELLMMGLRLRGGVNRDVFEEIADNGFEKYFHKERLEALVSNGLIQLDTQGLRATPNGRLRLNPLLAALVA